MASQDHDPFSSPTRRENLPPHQRSEREISLGLALSGMLIAISFIAMLVPLAVYQVAQVAAAVRFRTAVLLLFTVVLSLGLLGFTFGADLLLLGCLMGIFWAPLITLALYIRSRFLPSGIAMLAFLVPVLVFLACAFLIPNVPDLAAFLDSRKDQFLQVLQNSANITDPVLREKLMTNWQQSFAQIRELPEFDGMARVAAFSPWQRLSWVVYGGGAPFYFGLLLVAFGNLALLDFAFEQVEKFKAVVAYILRSQSGFPRTVVESLEKLSALKTALGTGQELPVAVSNHVRSREPKADGVVTFKSRLFNERPRGEVTRMWGFEFALERLKTGWNFKNSALPLWLGLASVLAMGGWVALFSDAEGILVAAGLSYGPLIGLTSVVAFALMALLAIQGVLVLYSRLSGFFLLLFLLVFLMLGSYVSLNPHLIVAVFGSIGLLDDVYDLRGRRARRSLDKVELP